MQVVAVKNDLCLSASLTWPGRGAKRCTIGCACKTFMHANIHYLWHGGTPVVVSTYRMSEHARRWREGGAVYLCHVAVQVEACNVFQGVGGVSGRAVMWDGCVGNSTLKLQGSQVDEEWDELVCITSHCIWHKQCAPCRIKRFLNFGHNNMLFSFNNFPKGSPVLCQNGNKPHSQYSQTSIGMPSCNLYTFSSGHSVA